MDSEDERRERRERHGRHGRQERPRLVDVMSLEDFCNKAHELHEEDVDAFMHFAITGVSGDRQASIDVVRNRILDDEVPTLTISRDYDSVLGIDKHVRIRYQDITIWPIAKHEDSLKRSIHLKYAFSNTTGDHVALVHQIPNLGLGKWGIHNSIRVLFPDLYSAERKSFRLSVQEQATFYEKGLLPTLQDLLADRGGDLPPDYQAEMFRARQQTGKLVFSTRILPADRVEAFGDTLRTNLVRNGVTWGANLTFLHEIRGVKNTSRHLFDFDNADAALDDFLDKNGLQLDTLEDSGEWYVDVGAEVSSTQLRCMAWRTDQHHTLAKQVLKINNLNATRITELTSSKYYRDPASHLVGASGFRITPGPRGEGPFEAQYFQAYLTDKPITSAKEANHFGKFITPDQLLKGKGEKYISELFHLYGQAANQNFSCARFEVRVPIRHARDVLLDIDLNKLRVSWLLNGLHSTPDDGPSYRELMSAILPRTRRNLVEHYELPFPISLNMRFNSDDSDDEDMIVDSEDEDDNTTAVVTRQRLDGEDDDEMESTAVGRALVPHIPYGVFFFRSLYPGVPVPRFRDMGIHFSDKTFKFLFRTTKTELRMSFAGSQISLPRDATRHHNRTRQRLIDEPQQEEQLSFSLEADGHDLLPPIRDDGSDIAENNLEEEGEFDDPLASGLDIQLERVWRQFPIDIVTLIPNHKGACEGSYCVIPKEELKDVTPTILQNTNICDIFDDVQWSIASKSQWEVAFNHLWPEKGVKKKGIIQNYGKAAYYNL
ncbi:hypothetical protein EST38_g13406, partial [Candolleomyces aberdarensis]